MKGRVWGNSLSACHKIKGRTNTDTQPQRKCSEATNKDQLQCNRNQNVTCIPQVARQRVNPQIPADHYEDSEHTEIQNCLFSVPTTCYYLLGTDPQRRNTISSKQASTTQNSTNRKAWNMTSLRSVNQTKSKKPFHNDLPEVCYTDSSLDRYRTRFSCIPFLGHNTEANSRYFFQVIKEQKQGFVKTNCQRAKIL